MPNCRLLPSNYALAALVLIGSSLISSYAQDAQFKHTRVYVGPSTPIKSTVKPRATGLTITATYDSSITGDKDGATIMATIDAAIAELASQYSDPITVAVTFKKVDTGLGASLTSYTQLSYVDYLAALKSHATTADDTTALSKLPTQTTNPVNGDANISLTVANSRVLGFTAGTPGQPDSTVSLNIGLMNISAANNDPTKYSLRETTLHELTEVLGSSSALGQGTTGPVNPIDLFRYDAMGNRSYTEDPKAVSFFSIDGTTTLAQFNQDKSGDFGDYYSVNGGQKPQIQDAFGSPGVSNVPLGTELIELDVVGYSRITGTPPGGTTPKPPVIASAAACSPNPAFIGGMCTLTVSATDPNNSPISVAWDFGDGTKGSGVSISHTYATAGMYTATATVVNGLGLSVTSNVVVNVSLTVIAATTVKQSFSLNFKVPNNQAGGKDSLSITLKSDGFANGADGTTVSIKVGTDIIDSGTLDKNKAVGEFGGKFTLNTRAGTLAYATTKGAIQDSLAALGATDDTVSKEVQVPIAINFNGSDYGDTLSFSYTGVAGKTGKGK